MLSVHATDKVFRLNHFCNWHHNVHVAGILCGECRDGKGVSVLLNDCVSCPNAQGLLILGLSKFSINNYYRKFCIA